MTYALKRELSDLCGFDVPRASTQHEPHQEEVHVRAVPGEDGRFEVNYITHDASPDRDFWKDDDGRGSLDLFRTATDRDAKISEVRRARRLAFIVDHYRHGSEHFSITKTRTYQHGEFDTAPRGVFVPCDDVQKAHRKDVRAAKKLEDPELRDAALGAAMEKVVKDSNDILNEYSDFVNGEVYGAIKENWTVDADGRASMDDIEEMWGLIGEEAALAEMKAGLRAEEPEDSLSPEM